MSPTVAEKTSPADALRAELAPSGLLQHFLVGQMALAMDRLTLATAREDRDDPAWLKYHAQAERTFYKAMAEFRRLVKAAAKGATRLEVTPPRVAGVGTLEPGPDRGHPGGETSRRDRGRCLIGPEATGIARPDLAAGPGVLYLVRSGGRSGEDGDGGVVSDVDAGRPLARRDVPAPAPFPGGAAV